MILTSEFAVRAKASKRVIHPASASGQAIGNGHTGNPTAKRGNDECIRAEFIANSELVVDPKFRWNDAQFSGINHSERDYQAGRLMQNFQTNIHPASHLLAGSDFPSQTKIHLTHELLAKLPSQGGKRLDAYLKDSARGAGVLK